MFEASEFPETLFSPGPTEIDAGGSVNVDSLSKCMSGCLSNPACHAVSYSRDKSWAKDICRFYKAPVEGTRMVGTGIDQYYTAKVVIMGRCENVAHYLDPKGQ